MGYIKHINHKNADLSDLYYCANYIIVLMFGWSSQEVRHVKPIELTVLCDIRIITSFWLNKKTHLEE